MLKNKIAQVILDYAFLILIVVAALIILGYYIRSSLSGRLREAADVFGGGEVYSPYNTIVTEY